MLPLRAGTGRRALLVVPALLAFVVAGCGDDDDDADPGDTVTIDIAGSGTDATDGTSAGQSDDGSDGDSSDDDSSDDDEPTGSTHDIPSLEEVGRADFTHTIVAGDFLRKIADTYGVEIDDIVGANEWSDGRQHMLYPGDVVYLPADAEMPEVPDTTAAAAETTAAPTDATVTSVP